MFAEHRHLGRVALGAGCVDALLALGHRQPGRLGAQAAIADIVERCGIGIGAAWRA
ncbi:MAG: hypothetical protein WDN44_14045 [Sphingomonas sp.]